MMTSRSASAIPDLSDYGCRQQHLAVGQVHAGEQFDTAVVVRVLGQGRSGERPGIAHDHA